MSTGDCRLPGAPTESFAAALSVPWKPNGFVIGLNIPRYLNEFGDLVKDLAQAKVYRNRAAATRIANQHAVRTGLEYFVDEIRDGVVVPMSAEKGGAQ